MEKLYFTTAAATEFIKSQPKGCKFAVFIRADAHIEDDPTKIYSQGCFGSLMISRKNALDLSKDLLSKSTEEIGGRMQFSISSGGGDYRCVYLG